jgi:RND family efflux transporter MFP subunit
MTDRHDASPVTRGRRILGIALPVLIVLVSLFIAAQLVTSAPQADRQGPRERQARLVTTWEVSVGEAPIRVEAMGTVAAARSANLRARVAGEIVEVSPQFIPGGHFEKGEPLLRIDPSNYKLAVARQRSAVSRAQAELRLEQANQAIARREYQALGEEIPEQDRGLVLREPQLQQIQADLASARSALESAQLDLERTTIRAPFSGILTSRLANLGDQADGAQSLGALAATDSFWVTVSVPVSQLRWIDIPRSRDEAGAAVRIFYPDAWGPDVYREGAVLRLEGALEEQGRMARLLIEVPDPLGLQGEGRERLLLGAYVRAQIQGQTLQNVVALPPGLLQADDTVRVMRPDGRLELRPVTVIHRSAERVIVGEGLQAGERVVVTPLSGATDGMLLRVAASEAGDA